MSRYKHLYEAIDQHKPRTLVEIGTHSGKNAKAMIRAALKHHEDIAYVGYDLFEDATPETDAREFNVKPHKSQAEVMAMLKKNFPDVDILLIKGDTRETLKSVEADLVFLDGGHSVETILHDYHAVRHSKVIVFDDYYEPDASGKCPDTSMFGCNTVIDYATRTGKVAVITETQDALKDAGLNRMVILT